MTKECDQNMNIIIHHYHGHTYKVKLPDRDRKNETVCSEHFSYLYSLDSPEVDILVVFVAQRNILFKAMDTVVLICLIMQSKYTPVFDI